jgi:hypothetical protein
MNQDDELKYEPDVVSDPEEGVDEGQDWTDEGGATESGPAEGYEI